MNALADLLDDPSTTIAVVGATDDPSKYGGVVYRRMKALGYRVYAVNPNRTSVDGDPAYPDLTSLPESPTLVNFVVPPHVGADVANEAMRLGHTNLWFQPGAESDRLTDRLRDDGASVLTDACVMVRGRLARM